jgi:Domain of unknown function (DUF4136)
MKRFIILTGILMLLFGCASLDVSYDYDPEINFAALRTFDWLPVPEKAQAKAQSNELTIKHIKLAVSRELNAKGLQMSSENPDILIALHGGKEKKVDVQEWGYGYRDRDYSHWGLAPRGPWYPQPAGRDYFDYRRGLDTYEYEVGTLIIDFIDAKTKSLIWRGTATGVVDPTVTSEKINEVVKKILENFPPEKKK